jgi:hypothetical protein
VNDIGVTEAWLWPCIFCSSIRDLRRTIIGVTHCGHYAAVTKGNIKNSKIFLNYPSDKNNFKCCLRNRSYCHPAVAVHILSLNQGTTPKHYRSNSMRPLRCCRTSENRDKERMFELLVVEKQVAENGRACCSCRYSVLRQPEPQPGFS